MRKIAAAVAVLTLALTFPLLPACTAEEEDEGGHSVVRGGVGHRPGLEAPLDNCTECHGAALRGGRGPSCYSCHGQKW